MLEMFEEFDDGTCKYQDLFFTFVVRTLVLETVLVLSAVNSLDTMSCLCLICETGGFFQGNPLSIAISSDFDRFQPFKEKVSLLFESSPTVVLGLIV